MRIAAWLLAIAVAVLAASVAYAQRPRVVVLDSSLPKPWVESLVWEVSALHGVQFLPTKYKRDPLNGAQMRWADVGARVWNLRNTRLHRAMRRYGPVHYLLGKTTENYIAGAALLGQEISVGYVGQVRANGNDASELAVTVITHEVGHNRCATHTDDASIMNTLALHFPTQPRVWNPRSVQEMLGCRQRVQKILCARRAQ